MVREYITERETVKINASNLFIINQAFPGLTVYIEKEKCSLLSMEYVSHDDFYFIKVKNEEGMEYQRGFDHFDIFPIKLTKNKGVQSYSKYLEYKRNNEGSEIRFQQWLILESIR